MEYVTKGIATSMIAIATGRGRRVIENIIDKLAQAGRITVEQDPIDGRALRMPKADVDVVIQYIKGGGN